MINWKLEKINLTIARIVNIALFQEIFIIYIETTKNKNYWNSVQQVESGGICSDINCQRNMQYKYIVGKTYEIYF
jgi:hypothetical protein